MGRQLALHALGTPPAELSVRLSKLRAVPLGFGLVPRLLLPYYRFRDALSARFESVVIQ
jgi:hypothetical protein